jgi:hypothetical protein
MKHLKTFEGLFSKLKEIGLSNYLIKYNVTNYKASKEEWELGEYSEKWDSEDYEYVISANSEEDARNKFVSIWSDKANFIPKPKLNILSVKQLDDKETFGSFKNKLHTY